MPPNETDTRKRLIDPTLFDAGWDVNNPHQVGIEVPVDGYDAEPWNGVTDYVLHQPNGEIIAVVEAKRQTHDPRLAQQQALHYVIEIEKHQNFRPFVFLTDGNDIYFWDSQSGEPKRHVAGFFTLSDLERLLYLRENQTPLADTLIDNAITDRTYQHEAIRRLAEIFEVKRKRRALLVMATGTGKTRTSMSLIDIFMRSGQAQNILFVADRDALVRQALDEGFKKYIPDEPCTRIWSSNASEIQSGNRLFTATLQTLNQCFDQFNPGFFDLIVFDEVHRSIFNKWHEIFDYFDARMIGLTATPAEYIDRNTFNVFHCYDGIPTYLYTYQQAIDDEYLVDFELYVAQTHFQRSGIRGADLSEEERNLLIDQGIDPDDMDYSGTDLEHTVSNIDTLRKQWAEFWDVCIKDESGQLPGKTIVFATTQKHALRLAQAFEDTFPQHTDLIGVITHQSDYRGQLMEKFKHQDNPRIAISVDMLDTGIDVPEVVNLVFMKPVHSYIKLQQMIGRGTRADATVRDDLRHMLPNGEKEYFLIIDFWENDFDKDPNEAVAQSLPVLVSLFNTRLDIAEALLHDQQTDDFRRLVADLRAQVDLIPTESFSVKRELGDIEGAWKDGFWHYLTPAKLEMLRRRVGPLLRYAERVDVGAYTFIHKVERLKRQIITSGETAGTAQSIMEDVSRLPDFVFEDGEKEHAASLAFSRDLTQASIDELNNLIDQLAQEMKNRRDKPNPFLEIDLPDYTELRGYIYLVERNERIFVEDYRRMVEKRIVDLVSGHPTVQAIASGEPVEDFALIELERTMREQLSEGGLELSEKNIRRAYGLRTSSLLGFLRHVLDMDAVPDYEDVVKRQFDEYITGNNFNATQIRFLKAVRDVFIERRRLELTDLYEAPLNRFGYNAVNDWFSEDEISQLLTLTGSLVA